MKLVSEGIRFSATDLSNHLHCEHLTAVNLKVARGELAAPEYRAPHLVVLADRGLEHEDSYVRQLVAAGLHVVHLKDMSEAEAIRRTREAMASGVEVIVQAALQDGQRFGRPDVLRKAADGLYEPYDCKLAKETKGATILQLLHYASLLQAAQGSLPENVYVVPPSESLTPETYRTLDYAAYYRAVRARLEQATLSGTSTYPEPNGHCDVCLWWTDCDNQRRRDDHLSLTAGISRLQRKQLHEWDTPTMELLSRLDFVPKPRHGTRAGYERVREQARVQVTGRTERRPIHELLPLEAGRGLTRLPEPSEGDIFFDLESDPFVGNHGLEYLFGYVTQGEYVCRWAMSAEEEKAAFEWFVDFAMEQRARFPGMHIYHYGHKEPSTLKALMGRYATREDEIDRLLRGGVLIDLHSITKQGLRASVETYSLKAFERFHHFTRVVPLDEATTAMRQVEHGLELRRPVEQAAKDKVQAYNADDCHSTRCLRNWLESLRGEMDRPNVREDAAPENVAAQQERTAKLFIQLIADIPLEGRTPEQSARWLLANLLDWHRRESKVAYWEKYHLRDLADDDLEDERKAISGLEFLRRIPPPGKQRTPIDEYSFPLQEVGLKPGDKLEHLDTEIGKIDFIDTVTGRVGIKKMAKSLDLHPTSVYSVEIINTDVLADSLSRIAESVVQDGFGASAVCDLLLRRPPRLTETQLVKEDEEVLDTAKRVVGRLDRTVLAIQGPPGAGKTFTGARMIVELIRQGKKVGITAGSHKVIRKLVDDVYQAAMTEGIPFRCLVKAKDGDDEKVPAWITEAKDNAEARRELENYSVIAGTSWLWAREEFAGSVDVLFVDEAGQMSLANALAVAPAAKSMVLLGDPQQLDQPLKGSHPDGAEVSALEHLLNGHKTIPDDAGLFLRRTRRLHPDICRFTSEAFYENKLRSLDGLENQRIDGYGSGLRYVPVKHEGNQNRALEEVDRIVDLIGDLLTVSWINDKGERAPIEKKDVLIVAPYNAQVAALAARLPGFNIGTVDKFQGQEAPVVIYSLTTSSPEDAPRGMEFLYSLNRLNVATSRAKALAILVASPKLLEPDCQSPRQMQLANALCRFVELAGGQPLTRPAT